MKMVRFLQVVVTCLWIPAAIASLNYSGRLVNSDGSPTVGPVNLRFELSYTNAPTVVVCSKTLTGVALTNGVFHAELDYQVADCGGQSLLTRLSSTPAGASVAIKLTDLTNSMVYSLQALHAVPFSVMAEMASTLGQMGATSGQVLAWNGTSWTPTTLGGGGGGGSVTSITAGTGLSGGTITASGTIGIAAGGVTSTEIANGSLMDVDVNTAAAISRSKLASGVANQVIINDGAGVLSSVATLPLTMGGTGSATASGARTALGLGTAAQADIGTGLGNVMSANAVPNCLTSQKLQMSLGPVYAWACVTDNVFTGGAISSTLDMGSNRIINLASPTADTDAANRAYVDAAILTVPSSQWTTLVGGHINFSGGRVGIGNSSPAEALDVAANGRFAGNLQVEGALRLRSSTATYVELRAPTTLASTLSFILPGTYGTNGQVLTTNGSGGLSWSAGGGSSNWSTSGSDIYRSTGNVGIGNMAPTEKLEVTGNILSASNPTTGALYLGNNSHGVRRNSGTNNVEIFTQSGNIFLTPISGNVGIATTSPNATLTIGNGTSAESYAWLNRTTTANNLDVYSSLDGGSNSIYGGFGILPATKLFSVGATGVGTAGWSQFNVNLANGRVGIGTNEPAVRLHILGSLIVGNGGEACDATLIGGVRYNGGNLQFCNATSWQSLAVSGSSAPGDNTVTSAKIVDGTIVNNDISGSAGIDASKLASGAVSNAEFGYLDGVTSALQTQLNNKEAVITVGTSAQYWRGDKTWQTLNTSAVPEGTNLYFLDSRVRAALLAGYATGSALPLSAGDSLLQALGKLEGSIASLQASGQWQLSSGDVYRATGYVGIGTTSPGSTLDVRQTTAAINGARIYKNGAYNSEGNNNLKLMDAAGTSVSLQMGADASNNVGYIQAMQPLTSWSNRPLVLQGNGGNVGVGTISPTELLEVRNSSGLAKMKIRGDGSASSTRAELVLDRTSLYRGAGIRIQGSTDAPAEWWAGVPYNNGSDADHFTIGRHTTQPEYVANSFFTINSLGNIGVGTSTPTDKLDVSGGITASTGTGKISLIPNYSGKSYIQAYQSMGVFYPLEIQGLGLTFSAKGSNFSFVEGNFGIGTASPSSVLDVTLPDNGALNGIIFSGQRSVVGGHAVRLELKANNSPAAANNKHFHIINMNGLSAGTNQLQFFPVNDNGSAKSGMVLSHDGNLGIATTSPGERLDVSGNVRATSFISTSDRQMKKDLVLLEGRSIIDLLNGYAYRWKSDSSRDYGVVAQEVERVLPYAVKKDPKTGVRAIKHDALFAPVIQSLKEIFAHNDEQDRLLKELEKKQSRIDALEQRLEKLERDIAVEKSRP